MARAALKWGVRDLAEKAGVDKNTISRFESGKGALPETLDRLLGAFAGAGVKFTDEGCVCPPSKQLRVKRGKAD